MPPEGRRKFGDQFFDGNLKTFKKTLNGMRCTSRFLKNQKASGFLDRVSGTFLEILFSKHQICLFLKANLFKITDFELKYSSV